MFSKYSFWWSFQIEDEKRKRLNQFTDILKEFFLKLAIIIIISSDHDLVNS